MSADKPMGIKLNRTGDEPNVREMVVIHRIFRREFRLLAALVRRVPPGHTDRARPVAEHLDFLLMGLHNHHSTEDDLLWPKLLDRATPHTELVHRMQAQHEAVAAHVERATKLLAEWRDGPTAASSTELADTLTQLDTALREHLDDEESELLPLVSKHITAAEWAQLGQESFDKFPRSALPMMLGQVLEEASPEERHWFVDDLPWFVRLGWRVSGQRRYDRYIRRVRGKEFGPRLSSFMAWTNRVSVRLYRRGIGRGAKGLPVMVLTVAGRRTGTPHSVPVAYFDLDDGRYLVAATAGGQQPEPQWIRNLRAVGLAEAQLDGRTVDVDAEVASPEERDRLWHDVVLARAPFFTKYERKSGRVIALATLTPLDTGRA